MDKDTRDMLLETAGRFFTERCDRAVVNNVEKGIWPKDLWKEIEEMGHDPCLRVLRGESSLVLSFLVLFTAG